MLLVLPQLLLYGSCILCLQYLAGQTNGRPTRKSVTKRLYAEIDEDEDDESETETVQPTQKRRRALRSNS